MASLSPNTVVQLVRAFCFKTHAQLHQFALKFGLVGILGDGGIEKKETHLMEHLVANPDLRGPRGGMLVLELIEEVIEQRCKNQWIATEPEQAFPGLVNALKQDGYQIVDHELRASLPDAAPVAEIENELVRLLEKHGLTTAKGHLHQAIAAHTRGDWAAANAQLRSFVEELFDRIAEGISGGQSAGLPSSHARREWLATCAPPFLDPSLNEWEVGDKGGFVQGFWKRLHPQGSHPGLSDEVDATFRLQLVIIAMEHFLRRFDGRI
jgi:hypothetical protein